MWRTGITKAPGEIALRLKKMTAEPKSPAVSFELWLGHAPKLPRPQGVLATSGLSVHRAEARTFLMLLD